MIHLLKTAQPYFDEIKNGLKSFEVRKDDRNFQVGDRLDLFEGTHEISNTTHRNHIHVFVIYKLTGGQFGIEEGYCVLGISPDEPFVF